MTEHLSPLPGLCGNRPFCSQGFTPLATACRPSGIGESWERPTDDRAHSQNRSGGFGLG
jgi:hypothetical protein